MLLNEDAAARLGMAVHEVVSVEEVDGGHVVVTHDGYSTLIADSGELVFGVDAIGERLATVVEAPAVDDEPEVVDDDPDGPGVDTDGDGVPEGSAKQILEWVGDDADKAKAALEAEQVKDKPRTGLVAALEKLVAAE